MLAAAEDVPYLLFANRQFIQRCNLDGSELKTLVNRTGGNAIALDYDYRQVLQFAVKSVMAIDVLKYIFFYHTHDSDKE